MKRSRDRILATHVGSLSRPRELIEAVVARERDAGADETGYQEMLRR